MVLSKYHIAQFVEIKLPGFLKPVAHDGLLLADHLGAVNLVLILYGINGAMEFTLLLEVCFNFFNGMEHSYFFPL